MLLQVIGAQPVWRRIKEHAERNGGVTIPFGTHATDLCDLLLILVQNFPTNADNAIVSRRLLHLDVDGLPKTSY